MKKQEKSRLENKVSLATGKNKAPISVEMVEEIADEMNIEMTIRQMKSAIKKGATNYGY